ncbi:MAG: peptidoglycan-binding domain-containing protein, partial [Clostridia bacterium]|nr:peptidoglycan-binding domain-containing protein [Clostridia bacterium]
GESCTFDTQINAMGGARLVADDAAYETLNLTLRVDAYKDPAYFEATYSDTYNLQGNEAAIMFDLTLNGYTGTTEIIPQNFLLITCCGEDASVTAQSFQLMDSEIAGKTNIAITSDVTSTLYKRYDYNADQGDMVYMVVTTYNDGKAASYWFEIQGPEEEPVAEAEAETQTTETPASEAGETEAAENGATAGASDSGIDPDIWLTIGSRGEEVKKLQAKLIELGLLTGSPDGQYGKYTASAVQIMQKKFGMEQTGVATASFLKKLYSGE